MPAGAGGPRHSVLPAASRHHPGRDRIGELARLGPPVQFRPACLKPRSWQRCGQGAARRRTHRCGPQGGPHESWRERRGGLLHGLADGGRPFRNVAEELPDRGVQTALVVVPLAVAGDEAVDPSTSRSAPRPRSRSGRGARSAKRAAALSSCPAMCLLTPTFSGVPSWRIQAPQDSWYGTITP